MYVSKKKNPLTLEFFIFDYLGEDVWGKNCIYQDNIGLWIPNICLKKCPPLVLEFFKSDYLRGDKGQNCILQDNIGLGGTQNVHLKNDPL